ncbi:26584_t:CDS:2, partial [Dentiscutata erythropus]
AQEIFESELYNNNSDIEVLQEIFESELRKNNSDVEILHAGHSHACCEVGYYNLNDNIFDKSLEFLHKARDLGCKRSLFYLSEYYRLVSPIDEYKS